ncbi:hypothetical protein ISN40_01455 [Enterobacter asburiae]|uniref:helix-turn-helix transcriptional regulator n=1 Tax=Enterobacter asburiae TaxID=61645 RepID=UPI0018873E3C|nr:hypothetical protein [Enterobacter asburiae]MBF2788899.1 hypothetical protein [Enterobacter asburiae]
MSTHSIKFIFISDNYYLQIALQHLIGANAISSKEFTRHYVYQHLEDAIVILDLSNVLDVSNNIKKMSILRMLSPHTKVVLLKSSMLNLTFLNQFYHWDVDISLPDFKSLVVKELRQVNSLCANSDVNPKGFTTAQVDFLFLYAQGLSMPEIAERLDIPLKTAYSRKTLLWRRFGLHRGNNIYYLLPHIKTYLQVRYPRTSDWIHHYE